MARKRRTREHIIADYSGIHFERFALDCGYSVERIVHDYGIDMVMYTYDANGELENEAIRMQLKATDAPNWVQNNSLLAVRIDTSDLLTWTQELMPVILIVYDAGKKIAYWLHIQDYFNNRFFDPTASETVTVHISSEQVLDAAAVRQFAQWENEERLKLLKGRRQNG